MDQTIALPEPYEIADLRVIPLASPKQFPLRFFDYPKVSYPTAAQAALAHQRGHGWRPTVMYEYAGRGGVLGRWMVEA